GTAYEPWEVTADADGNFTTTWFVFSDELANTTLQLTSIGESSALTAQATFSDSINSFAMSFPVNGNTYNSASFDAGNGTPGGDIGGTVQFTNNSTDPGGAVTVSIRQGSGNYWDGTSFSSASEMFFTASGTITGNGNKTWSLAFSSANFPASG